MKLKNHSGAAKRFRRTGSGKFMRRRAGLRHILTSKTRGRKRLLGTAVEVDKTNRPALANLLPYPG
ncbi:MAG: 50S ribosomal protein L35 [Nitrospirales bacterium]|nr:50S ribosomal protein L35 [Nitrospirales bacterium]